MRKTFTGMDGFRIDRENKQKNAIQQDVKKVRKKSKYMLLDVTYGIHQSKYNGKDHSYLPLDRHPFKKCTLIFIALKLLPYIKHYTCI